MRQPDVNDRTLRRALWELATVEDSDRQWVVGQLSEAERKYLSAAIEQLEASPGSRVAPQFSEAVRTEADGMAPPAPGQAAPALDSLPDWLAIRVLVSLTSAERREALRQLPWHRRWQLRRRLLTERAGICLTAATAEALLASVRERGTHAPTLATSP